MHPPNPSRPPNRPSDSGSAPLSTPAPPSGYELLGELGRGGMGVVYKARQRGLNRIVALKMLLSGAHATLAVMERFRREAEAVARLSHPNIVQVYEVGETGGLPYFTLEYVGGGSLADAVRGTPMPARLSAHLVAALADAVQAAHAQGVVHRDLKPSNVLLATPTGQPPGPNGWASVVPKICDFGLAKRLDAADGPAATRTGEAVGTISYMAPEQLEASSQVGPAADVYALGAILYDLLTGRPPFLGESELNTVWMLMSQEPVTVRQLSPKVPADLETICHKCLSKEPARRYRSAGELGGDLRRFLCGQAILARPASSVEQAGKWVRRHPMVAGLSGALLLAVAAGATGVIWKWTDAERLKREAETQRAESDRRAAAEESQRKRAEQAESDARQRADDEFSARQEAVQASQLAESRGREARAAALEASTAAAEARRQLYHAQITVAASRLLANDVAGAQAALTECSDTANWEWRHLTARCATESWRFAHPRDARALWVNGLAFSADGQRLYSGAGVAGFLQVDQAGPGDVRVWSLRAGRPDESATQSLNPALSPSRKSVLCLAVSASGLLVESSRDGVRLWEPTGPGFRLRWHVPTPTEQRTAPFAPDGASVLVGRELLAMADGRRLRTLELTSPTLAADGRVLGWHATESGEHEFRVLAADGGKVLLSVADPLPRLTHGLPGPFQPVLSPDGRRLAYRAGQQVRVLSVADGRLRLVLRSPAGEVAGPVFSPDGRHLASGGHDLSVRVWDAETGDVTAELRGHGHVLTALAFGPDGRHLASGDYAGSVRVWDLAAPAERLSLTPVGPLTDRMCLDAIAFSADGQRLMGLHALGEVTKTGDARLRKIRPQLHVWDVVTGAPLSAARLESYDENWVPVRRAAFSADGRVLVAVGRDVRSVGVWELDKLIAAEPWSDSEGVLPRRALLPSAAPVMCVAVSADGRRAFAGGWSRPERRIDNRIWTLSEPPTPVRVVGMFTASAAAFSPAWDVLAVGGAHPEDGRPTLSLFDGRTGDRLRELTPVPEGLSALAFTADGKRLAAVGRDGVAVFAVADGRPLARGQIDGATELAFTPNGARLVAVSRDVIRLFDPADGATVLSLEGVGQRQGDRAFNPSLAVSPDGLRIAAGRTDGSVRVWSAQPPERARAESLGSVRAERGAVWHIVTANELLTRLAPGEIGERGSGPAAARFHLEASTALPVRGRWRLLERARLWELLGESARAEADRAAAEQKQP